MTPPAELAGECLALHFGGIGGPQQHLAAAAHAADGPRRVCHGAPAAKVTGRHCGALSRASNGPAAA
jgi:hypothetical protein